MWSLDTYPAAERLDLLAAPVASAIRSWKHRTPVNQVLVAPIDAALADTANFCAAYGVPLEASANCVVVAAKRGGQTRPAVCVVLATTRADVNGVVRKRLDARKASFAKQDDAIRDTEMEYGGITPLGLPADWPILVDSAVAVSPHVVVGSGLRGSKVVLPGATLTELPGAEAVEGLAVPAVE